MTTKLSTQNAHDLDKNIVFYEESHKYIILVDPKSTYTSVTTWIHEQFEKFDSDKIIDKMMKGKNWNEKNKYFGMTKKQIKDQWSQNALEVSSQGTLLHFYIEQFMNLPIQKIDCTHEELKEFYLSNLPFTDVIVDSVEWGYFMNYLDMFPSFIPYRTEWTIYDVELKLAGSIDMIYKNVDGTFMIYDWKRCKEITKNNPFNKYSINPCLDTVPDTNFWHYSLQLNIYKYVLEKNYGLTISSMVLVQLHPTNKNYMTYKVPDLSNTVLEFVKDRLKKLK
jgi:ATP-dependent exoDNAse (exonuclease V) beta subunit